MVGNNHSESVPVEPQSALLAGALLFLPDSLRQYHSHGRLSSTDSLAHVLPAPLRGWLANTDTDWRSSIDRPTDRRLYSLILA